ncbi:hypothetical protein B9Z55_012763 [Caenorhabditis nigoni]|uniref:F-box domain-containing protein n=1 Tax=Caenorhabditis nigoni TaxID=1611254 RepID=A0A2G5TYS6_9PELO|nr:hypothetical protein B9Z55_012763 [Caenorhabditis nigoni]
MASELQNLTEMTEKFSIDPVYETNWCDLSEKIKSKCIGKMEFNERLSLRCTAKAERSLVDSQKNEFNEGRFEGDDEKFSFFLNRNDDHKYSKRWMYINEAFELLKYIKKVGTFENLEISFSHPLTDRKHLMTETGLLTAKHVKFYHCNNDNMFAILRKMKDGVESIKIHLDRKDYDQLDCDEVLAIPQVQKVPNLHLQNYDQTDSLRKVAKMWIKKKAKIGTTFQLSVNEEGSFGEFTQHFSNRLVSCTDKTIRIRANKLDRHILLEHGPFSDQFCVIPQYFRMMVISAEMKESEYDDNREEWIGNMDPASDDDFRLPGFCYDDLYDEDYDDYYRAGYDSD